MEKERRPDLSIYVSKGYHLNSLGNYILFYIIKFSTETVLVQYIYICNDY